MSSKTFLDPHSDTPLFQQIVSHVERQIITGALKAGDFLTSVRDFAVQHGINPNTVAKAYSELQNLGLVEPIRGLGLKVCLPRATRSETRKQELLIEKIDECLKLAESLEVSKRELLELIKNRGKK